MADAVVSDLLGGGPARPRLDQRHSPRAGIVFCAVLALGVGYGLHGWCTAAAWSHEGVSDVQNDLRIG